MMAGRVQPVRSDAVSRRPDSSLYPASALAPLSVPRTHVTQQLVIRDAARPRGVGIHAGSGSGKSAMLGKSLCLQDFLRGLPQVVFDPHGPLIDNFLLSVDALPPEAQRVLWPRVRYVDLSGKGERVTTFPLLYRLADESLRDAADRFLEALRKVNPQLARAPILGFPAIVRVGRPVLMILAALGEPITAAEQLLQYPEAWEARIEAAIRIHPELAAAAAYLGGEYRTLKPAERQSLTRSFLVEIAPFALDPTMRDMFSHSVGSIDLSEVEAQRQVVLIDARRETNTFRRAFKTRWVYEWFLSYIKARGTTYTLPIGLVIDELTELTNQVSVDVDLYARDLDELINVYARNYGVWLTLAHQEMFQLSPDVQRSLLTMGTQVFGVTADFEAAQRTAQQFFAIDPYHVKRVENVWGSDGYGSTVVEERDAYMSVDEQVLLAAQRLMALQPFEFLVKRKDSPRLVKASLRALLSTPWPSDHVEELAAIRQRLEQGSGIPRSALHAAKSESPTGPGPHDTLEEDTYDTHTGSLTPPDADDDDWSAPAPW